MRITKVSIRGFRNIEEAQILPGVKINLLYGANGQGKTNFLEAIYTSLRAKSFRPYSQKQDWFPINRELSQISRVDLELENASGFTQEVSLVANSDSKWDYFLNQKKITPAKLRTQIPIVVFSPDDHAIIRGAPELRRQYLDEVLMDVCPGYSEVLNRFDEALKSRNRILKQESTKAFREYTEELKAWTEIYAQSAAELIELRFELWPNFEKRFEKLGKTLFQDFGITQKVIFESDFPKKSGQDVPTNVILEHVLRDLEKDLVTGWTHRGPHRDDLKMLLDGVDSRSSASQGQARLCALLLKWLHAEWVMDDRQEIPLFIIDDLSSELDASRRKKLIDLTQSINGQIFVSTTDVSLVDLNSISEYTKFFVKNGVYIQKNP